MTADQLFTSEELLDASIHAIQSGSMPVGAELSVADKRTVINHLIERRQEIQWRKSDLNETE
jgi:hypothetical protein